MIRLGLLAAAPCVLVTACGGPDTSQANNAQANISDSARTETHAAASAVSGSGGQVTIFAGPVSGGDATRIMHERHEGMESMGKTAKAIKGQFDSGSPDLAAVRASAAKVEQLSQKANGWFPAGTGPNVGKTGAKPDIWQGSTIKSDFISKLAAEQKAMAAFSAAAAGTDVAAMTARFSDLGRTCKACHDTYRTDMHHH